MTALDKLIEAVEAGTSDRQYLLQLIDMAMPQDSRGCMAMAHQAYHGSLDAALSLHSSLLPEWTRGVDATAPECGIDVELFYAGQVAGAKATNDIEARAWLLAVLRAYRSVQA